jgi:hypothetical protein
MPEDMVAARNHPDPLLKKFIGFLSGDPLAPGRILTVRNHEFQGKIRKQGREYLFHRLASRAPKNIPQKKNPNQTARSLGVFHGPVFPNHGDLDLTRVG